MQGICEDKGNVQCMGPDHSQVRDLDVYEMIIEEINDGTARHLLFLLCFTVCARPYLNFSVLV